MFVGKLVNGGKLGFEGLNGVPLGADGRMQKLEGDSARVVAPVFPGPERRPLTPSGKASKSSNRSSWSWPTAGSK
jgi:hypothetical protein